jgi:PII-like signaling protein
VEVDVTRDVRDGKLVRIFIGEDDRAGARPLHETILLTAREMGLGGCTVLRGIAGFGATSMVHTAHILRLSSDLPIVVEVVESSERLDPFIERIQEIIDEADCGALITLEKAEVIRYRPDRGSD